MTDAELKPVLTQIETYEGRVPWLYQDSADHPNVTLGVGCLIASVEEACALPFVNRWTNALAPREEIATDFLRVKSMRGGMLAAKYRGAIRLSETAIDQLGFTRLRTFLADLRAIFPGYDGFPSGPRQALLDLAWNTGTGNKRPGLRTWTHLLTACNRIPPEWPTAAKECRTANPDRLPARETRNDWRSQQFIEAAARHC